MGEPFPATGSRGARTGLAGRAAAALAEALLAETDRWFLWAPVLFAAGIAVYFSLYEEPSWAVVLALPLAALALVLLSRGRMVAWGCSLALLCAALGFVDAKLRAGMLATPTLERKTGVVTVSGRVEYAEPQLPEGYRLTLRVRAIEDARSPVHLRKMRVTSRFEPAPPVGTAVRLRAVMYPPPEPVMPGGFDFARALWFDGIGAVGFSISRPEALNGTGEAPLALRLSAAVDHVRRAIDARFRAVLPGEPGSIASALITGERGRIPESTLRALRHSGLAHVLAISGLHMALMAGTLYWLARAGMAAVPALALRLPVKKIAAVMALAGGAFYLALSGAGLATQRAFLMLTILFLAVLLDRPAITLRNVALAAILILALFPESLFNVSFQMSFAAAAALVAFYEHWSRRRRDEEGKDHPLPVRLARQIWRYFAGIALTTLVANLAVAPFAAFHFHKLAQYGLAANLAAMPLVGIVVMPSALMALLAMPFGLEAWPLMAMGRGIDAIVHVAETVSGWNGAVIRVSAMPAFTLGAVVFGGLWLMLWRGRWRFAGLLFAALGLAVSGQEERPDMLVQREGELVAVRDQGGALAATRGRAGRFSLERWLAADGDAPDTAAARAAGGFSCDAVACIAETGDKTVAFLLHPAALREECARAEIVVAKFPLGYRCKAARVTVDRMDLIENGAHALYLDGHSIRVDSVAAARGSRPWTRGAPDPPAPAEPDDGRAYAGDGEGTDQ